MYRNEGRAGLGWPLRTGSKCGNLTLSTPYPTPSSLTLTAHRFGSWSSGPFNEQNIMLDWAFRHSRTWANTSNRMTTFPPTGWFYKFFFSSSLASSQLLTDSNSWACMCVYARICLYAPAEIWESQMLWVSNKPPKLTSHYHQCELEKRWICWNPFTRLFWQAPFAHSQSTHKKKTPKAKKEKIR